MCDDRVAGCVTDACKVKSCLTIQGFRPGISAQSTGSRRPAKAVVQAATDTWPSDRESQPKYMEPVTVGR